MTTRANVTLVSATALRVTVARLARAKVTLDGEAVEDVTVARSGTNERGEPAPPESVYGAPAGPLLLRGESGFTSV